MATLVGPDDRDDDKSAAEHDARDDYESTYGLNDRHDGGWDSDSWGIEHDDGSSEEDARDWDDFD